MNKIRIRAMIYSMVIVLILISFFVYSIYQDKKRVLDEKTSSHRELLKNAFELSFSDTEKGLNRFAYEMMTDCKIANAFEAGNRDELYALAIPYFKKAHNHGEVDLSGFIRADGVHFLRLQDPKKFGDNITKKRPMLAEAIRTRQPITSLDVTLYNISLVRIVPIYKNQKFLGVLQVAAKIDRVQERLNAHSGIKSALAINSQTLKKVLDPKNLKQYSSYSIVSHNDPLFKQLPNNYNFAYSLRHTIEEKTFIIASRELKTYADQPLAKMICALEITEDEIAYKNEIIKLMFISIFMLFLLGGILHLGFRKLVQKINYKSANINKILKQQLHTDALTNLPNRRALLEEIQYRDNIGILLANIDNFKEMNDLYGHEMGDKILQAVADSIQKIAQEYALSVYKMHSDEYALLFNKGINSDTFDAISQKISHLLNEVEYTIDEINIFVRLSLGGDFCLNTAQCDVIERADMALKMAKKLTLSYLKYSDSLQIKEEYHNNILWTKKIKESIENDRFILYYQGIHDVATNEIYEYEALIRMVDTNGSIISPYAFLDIAKKSRLYPHITRFVIRTIFQQLKATSHTYSINLSVADILDTEMQNLIYDSLSQSGAGNRIIFEILESEGIENHTGVSAFITHVKTFGCRISIDDFGTGYSNFAHILRLNVDFIKIDASLIKNLNVDLSAQDIVRTIVEFAHRLNIKTVAEFVHSQDIYNECLELGIDYLQGFYLSEPSPL